ncbi:MAG: hypothetical protein SX243_02465 [Acidobacteriota bacterium]|nr:hypothetical protein [Acidobacteriota bacterium]
MKRVRRKRERQFKGAKSATRQALFLLKACDLDWLWKFCALISCHDLFGPTLAEGANALYVNFAKTRALVDLVLKSGARDDVDKILHMEEVRDLLNLLVDVQNDPEVFKSAEKAKGTPAAAFEFHRSMCRLGSNQTADQEGVFWNAAGRLIAKWELLPLENQSLLPSRERQRVLEVAHRIPEVLGAEISELSLVCLAIFQVYRDAYANLSRTLPVIPHEAFCSQYEKRQALDQLMTALEAGGFSDLLVINPRRLREMLRDKEGLVDSYLSLFSRSVEELRSLQKDYSVGQSPHYSRDLSVLDRFPLVRRADGTYIVPNVRFLLKSFVPNVEFTLVELLGDNFWHANGATQEAYLLKLLSARLPGYTLVEERAYGKQELRGPDVTIVDAQAEGLILVESKGKRIGARTRFVMSDDLLDDNLKVAYSALQGLPVKFEALLSGIPEYADAQDALDSARSNSPICVVVMNDSVMMMSELIRMLIAMNPEHQLQGFPFQFCIVGIGAFELAVEVASRNGSSLYRLLSQHWERSAEIDPGRGSADLFGGFWPDTEPAFGAELLRARLKSRLGDLVA